MTKTSVVTIAIGVPVRDEAALLPSLLDALAALDLTGVRATACFFLDGCGDASEAIVRAATLPMPVLVGRGAGHADANAGRARAAAMDVALGTDPAVLLSTDADSQPRRDWVQAALRALSIGEVATGRILRAGPADPLQTRVERYWDRLHALRRLLDPVAWEEGGCHHGGGANLVIRTPAYRALGGFRPQPSGEDALLLDDAARAGLRVRHDAAMVVETSARRRGRAPGGLATSLRALDAGGLPRVPHPAGAAWQYERHAAARNAFATIDDAAARARLGALLGLSGDHVLGVARDCPNAEAFAMRIVPAPPGPANPVPLAKAEAALALLAAQPCRGAA